MTWSYLKNDGWTENSREGGGEDGLVMVLLLVLLLAAVLLLMGHGRCRLLLLMVCRRLGRRPVTVVGMGMTAVVATVAVFTLLLVVVSSLGA